VVAGGGGGQQQHVRLQRRTHTHAPSHARPAKPLPTLAHSISLDGDDDSLEDESMVYVTANRCVWVRVCWVGEASKHTRWSFTSGVSASRMKLLCVPCPHNNRVGTFKRGRSKAKVVSAAQGGGGGARPGGFTSWALVTNTAPLPRHRAPPKG
jgi:hypothetical protein